MPKLVLRTLLCLVVSFAALSAQELQTRPEVPAAPTGPAKAPNSEPTYQQLRRVQLGNESVPANGAVLLRDAGTFTFQSGTICFLAPVNGKVTGAVFSGFGTFAMTPPIDMEKRSLSLLTKSPSITEEFNELVLRFTDNTYDELKKGAAGGTASGSCPAGLLSDSQDVLRKRVHFNLTARILQDVLSEKSGGLFVAFIHGRKYDNKLIYAVDPHGAPDMGFLDVAPEEVELLTYDDAKYGIWSAFHLSNEYATGMATGTQQNGWIHVEKHQLDSRIEKSGRLNGKATTTFVSQADGLRVVPFHLFHTLRVESVTAANGEPLHFIQEDKNEDFQFSVILPKPLNAGEKLTITTAYAGKDAVQNEGGGNYYPVARYNWYPNTRLGEFAEYEMRFSVAKNMKMAATGTLISEANEGDQYISSWKSSGPQTVAGFNFGNFKQQETKLDDGYSVESLTNKEPPAIVQSIKAAADSPIPSLNGSHMGVPVALGNMDTTVLMKKALAEGELSMKLYTSFFGPEPYKRVALTQQTAMNYGQSWPGLVYLPITYFFDSTTRHGLGMDDPRGYFKIVGPHEVAHQWWGHTVTWNSYRDQWMSEGFADMSASLFMQAVRGNKEFLDFWKDEKQLLVERNKEGFRAIDVGALTMGYRLMNSKAGFDIPRHLLYPKGAYVLHMVRMMMWSPKTGDENFKVMMKDFVQTYGGHAVTTEDFKAAVEKHMTPAMNLSGNHRMDWFFDSYVYGTALPNYSLQSSFERDASGTPVLKFKLTQSNVTDNFHMLVPIYMEMADGKISRLGAVPMTGNTSMEQSVPLKGLKDPPRQAMLNYYYDVLSTVDGK